jgi:hypothetical protein
METTEQNMQMENVIVAVNMQMAVNSVYLLKNKSNCYRCIIFNNNKREALANSTTAKEGLS